MISENIFPKHLGLYLTHNEHKLVYASIPQFEEDADVRDCWVSEEQRQNAIVTDNMWILHYYPDNSVGFYQILAADLDILLTYARKDLNELD